MNKITNSANRITELITVLGISQKEFAISVGLDESTISLYINGKREPRQKKLAMISEKYDIDPAWLMGYDVPMRKLKTVLNAEQADEDFILLDAFHRLPEDKRKLLIQMAKSMT